MGFQVYWDPRTKDWLTEEELLERWQKEHAQEIDESCTCDQEHV